MIQKLTIKEALEQGYTLCGADKGEWTPLHKIESMTEFDFQEEKIMIAEKEYDSPTINANSIRDMIAESMESNWGNDTGDDTEQVYDEVMKLDFTQCAEMVNKALEGIKSYELSDIELIWEN
jgi:hypothetical protein